MDKEKYLSEIEKKLKYLNNEQKQEEIFRISNELDSGKKMPDIDEEVDSIYKKYKINPNKKEKIEKNSLVQAFKNLFEVMKKNNWKDNLTIIKDIIVILLIVSLLKIPFIGIENLFFSIFREQLIDKAITVFNICMEVSYVIFAIFMLIRLFRRRFKEEMKLK